MPRGKWKDLAPEGFLSGRQVAELLHIHPHTVSRWTKSGDLPGVRVSGRGDLLFALRDIEHWIQAREQPNGRKS